MTLLRRFIVPLVWFILFAGGIAAVLVFSETAREVTADSLQLVFTVVATPFIFETTIALVFFLGLLAYNRWRLHKEGDGWVYLTTQETPAAETGTGAATARLHSMILPNKPEPVDAEQDEAGVIEGYLELGFAAQALEELNKDPEPAQTLDRALLRIRVLAANLDTEAALSLQQETASRHPEAQARLAQNAEQTTAWMREHLPSHADEARLWLEEADKMTVS